MITGCVALCGGSLISQSDVGCNWLRLTRCHDASGMKTSERNAYKIDKVHDASGMNTSERNAYKIDKVS